MKKLLNLLVLLFITFFSYAQFSRFYIVDLPKYSSPTKSSNYNLYFSLCKDGSYGVHVEENPYFDMILTGFTISLGKYEVLKNTVILTDSYTGGKMSFQIVNSFSDSLIFSPTKPVSLLKPLKTFPFIKNLVFDVSTPCGNGESWYKMKEVTAEKIVHDFKIKSIKNIFFKEGLYRFEYIHGEKFEIILDKDNKYEYSIKFWKKLPFSVKEELVLYLVISSGDWEREGNILTLWDTNLQHKFYGLIREDGIEFLFFRWVEDMIFKKQ
jgi:hypothetical protein